MLFYFKMIFANTIFVVFQTFGLEQNNFVLLSGFKKAHLPSTLPICLGVAVFSVCLSVSGGSRQLSEAVIWHVSECVVANQTEGPL